MQVRGIGKEGTGVTVVEAALSPYLVARLPLTNLTCLLWHGHLQWKTIPAVCVHTHSRL